MIISEVQITKFRGFQDVRFSLGKSITIIAGQNGTMKSTLLGMIGQPFSVKGKDNPITDARTIDGSRFTAPFQDKFRLSEVFDPPGTHKWKLIFRRNSGIGREFFEIESIPRNDPKSRRNIRFWSTEGRSRGMGYIQVPVIFLSLKRITPIGEEKNVKFSSEGMTDSEREFFNQEHKSILSILDDFSAPALVTSTNKSSLGAVTDYYDANSNSAGQDNIGKILLAVLSFKRLKETYPEHYKGGILLIDEVDATLFPSAQQKLIRRLFHYASKFRIQIIATSHSLSVLEEMYSPASLEHGRIVYLRKRDRRIEVFENPPFRSIQNDIEITAKSRETGQKIEVYCEDSEGFDFFRHLLPDGYLDRLELYDNVSIGGDNLRTLVTENRIPHFCQSLIVLDGDKRNTKGLAENIIFLPKKELPPDRLFYEFLKGLPETDDFWSKELGGYTKQICFFSTDEKKKERDFYKIWYKGQCKYWGEHSHKLIHRWMQENEADILIFRNEFTKAYNYLSELEKNRVCFKFPWN